MGTNSSSVQDKLRHAKGDIFITLNKTNFVSNELISGILSVNLMEPFQGHILQIELEGIESIKFIQPAHYSAGLRGKRRGARGGGCRGAVNVDSKKSFLNFAIPIYDFSQGNNSPGFKVQPGQWQIPFQISVAQQLTSSFSFFENDSTNGSIKYNLCGRILSTDSKFDHFSGFQEICITQIKIAPVVIPQIQSAVNNPETMYCCHNGMLQMSASIEKTIYFPSETIKVNLNCDFSKYKGKVTSLTVSFFGNLQLLSLNPPAVKKIQKDKKQVVVPVTGSKVTEIVEFEIPKEATCTVFGSLLSLSYQITIQPDIEASCHLTQNPPFMLIAMIHQAKDDQYHDSQNNQLYPQMQTKQLPSNWHPVQLQQQQFNEKQAFSAQQQQVKQINDQELSLLQNMTQAPMMHPIGGTQQKNISYV